MTDETTRIEGQILAYESRQKQIDELRCSGCHPEKVPEPAAGNGYCPLVARHRDACAVCHEGREEVLR